MPRITELNIYPVKSCRGIALSRAVLQPAGLEHDREWMIVRPDGRFVTQREQPRLALIVPALEGGFLVLRAPEGGDLRVPLQQEGAPVQVQCWRDVCSAWDAGEAAASWLSRQVGESMRLVRFESTQRRLSSREWTHGVEAENRFSDGFPVLLISEGSLADLNSRLEQPLPMNRFRPNLVVSGLLPYQEDAIDELVVGDVTLRAVKPCTRCVITTTDQHSGEVTGPEPIRTLRTYRLSRNPPGVLFGQNLIVVSGADSELRTGMELAVRFKATGSAS
ncbi:MAG: MOSC N-terminal beta barrel domain-containing protein [Steroidobacteraceae bacterium]